MSATISRLTGTIITPAAQLPSRIDIAIMGSGAAGLVAAVRAADSGAQVVVLEKADLLGGTTAIGGGVMWLPATRCAADAGYSDSPAAAAAYLRAATGGRLGDEEIETYLGGASRVADYLLERTRVALRPLARPDYRSDWPGATRGGRSLDNEPFDVSVVPGLGEVIRPSSYFPPLSMAERDALDGRAPDPGLLAERRAAGVRTMGGALVASLVATALDRGVLFSTGSRVTGLDRLDAAGDDEWAITLGGDTHRIVATSIVIASGGFEWDTELQRAFLPHSVTPISAPSNTGDGLRLGLRAGAAVSEMTTFWGVPVITPPDQSIDGLPSGRMGNVEMTLPGSITVNQDGRRFVNEALNYHDASRVFGSIDPHRLTPSGDPAWLVCDSRYRERYPIAGITADEDVSWIVTAPTLTELATRIGVDAAGLASQVAQFNADARTGADRQFSRGSTPQDRFLGDDAVTPNPCLAPIDTPPFSAVRIHCGTLGTSGGLAVDARGRVLDHSGGPIPGLFAAGNASATMFRGAYPGGGATLGSAVVRAFAVGEGLAERHRHLKTAPIAPDLASEEAPR